MPEANQFPPQNNLFQTDSDTFGKSIPASSPGLSFSLREGINPAH